MLVMTSAGHRLEAGAAASYEAMNAAFRAAFGKNLAISSGARTNAEQEAIFRRHYTSIPINGRPRRWWNGQWWYQRPGFATVAVPKTSNHEYPPGLAADFGSGAGTYRSAEHNWMRANAHLYGWIWPLWAQGRTSESSPINPGSSQFEAWHWEKRGPVLAGGDSAPFNPEKKEPEMTPEQFAYLQAMNTKLDWLTQGLGVLASAVAETTQLAPGMNAKLDDLVVAAEKLLAE